MDQASTARYRTLDAGEPAPWFRQDATGIDQFEFASLGGRYILLGFFGSASDATARNQLKILDDRAALFDDLNVCFFGVSADPTDKRQNRLKEALPGRRHFWDFDRTISKLYGASAITGQDNAYRRFWVLIDPTLRVMKVWPMLADASNLTAILDMVDALPAPGRFAGPELMAPVLYLPNVVPSDLCQQLIDAYEAGSPIDSGFMREHNGLTTVVHDHGFKRRRDFTIEDEPTLQTLRMCIHKRIRPEILKVHHFDVTRMERYLVACYTAEDGGHFRPHRDNTTRGTAHRKFAVSINLNDDFDGGDLTFPEYGPRSLRPPLGGAVVFSCSLLHTVSKVTRGKRYAFLPFLYDDAAAKLREANNSFLDATVTPYSEDEQG